MDAVACDYFIVDDDEENLERKNCIKYPIGCGIMFKLQHLLEMGLYDKKFQYAETPELRVRFPIPPSARRQSLQARGRQL